MNNLGIQILFGITAIWILLTIGVTEIRWRYWSWSWSRVGRRGLTRQDWKERNN